MKLSQKIISMVEASSHDFEAIADYLCNAGEEDTTDEAVGYLEDEFQMNRRKAEKLVAEWHGMDARKRHQLGMSTSKLVKWIDSVISVDEVLHSSKDKIQQAIAYVINDERFSDADLKNLYLMVSGEKPADFKPAKKVLDKIQHRVKYVVDGFGLEHVKNVLDNMGISENK